MARLASIPAGPRKAGPSATIILADPDRRVNPKSRPAYRVGSMAASPFDILGLGVSFDLDQADIEQAYLARIASAHPDLGAADGSADPSVLNEARTTLLDPESRARAVLAIQAPHAKAPPLSSEFLA